MAYQEGQTATNPKTGQKVVYRNGQWVSAAAGGTSVGQAMTQNRRSEMRDSLTSLDQFEADLGSLETSFDSNFKNQGIETAREYLPGFLSPTNQDYNATSQRLLPLVAKALGFASKQMDTPAELKRLESYVPRSADSDVSASHKLKNLRGMLDRQRGNIQGQLGVRQQPKPHGKKPANSRVIDFNDLPE